MRGTDDPALEALDYIQQLNARGRRVTARRSRLGGEPVEAPIGHVTERWRRLIFEGRKGINASMYEVAAFEALNHGLRSGGLYVVGSRRCQTLESYLLSREQWAHLKERARRAWRSGVLRRVPRSSPAAPHRTAGRARA